VLPHGLALADFLQVDVSRVTATVEGDSHRPQSRCRPL
jgi:hypothetical protein